MLFEVKKRRVDNFFNVGVGFLMSKVLKEQLGSNFLMRESKSKTWFKITTESFLTFDVGEYPSFFAEDSRL